MAEAEEEQPEFVFRLTRRQATVLDLERDVPKEDIQKKIDFLYHVYSNERFAPLKNDMENLRIVMDELGLKAKPIRRGLAKYCGNYYLLPYASLATPAECRQRGHYWGDRHGKIPAVAS